MEIGQKQITTGTTRANVKDDEMPTDTLSPGIKFVTELSPVLVWHTLSSAIPAPRQVYKDKQDDCINAEEHAQVRKHLSDVSIIATFQKPDPKEMDDTESTRLNKWRLPEDHSPTKYFDNSGYFDIPVHRDDIIIDAEVPKGCATKKSQQTSDGPVLDLKKPANSLDCNIDVSDIVESNSALDTGEYGDTVKSQDKRFQRNQHSPLRPNTSHPVEPYRKEKPRSMENVNYKDGVENYTFYDRSAEHVDQRSYKGPASYRHNEPHKNRKHGGGKGKTKVKESENVSIMTAPIHACKDNHEDDSIAGEYALVREQCLDVSKALSAKQSEAEKTDAFGSIQANEGTLQDENLHTTYCDISKNFNSSVHRDNLIMHTEVPSRCRNNASRNKNVSQDSEQKKPAKLLDCSIDRLDNEGSNPTTGARKAEPTILLHNSQFLGNQHKTIKPNPSQPLAPSPKEKPRLREKSKYLDQVHSHVEDDVKCHVKYKKDTEHVGQRNCNGQYSDRHDGPRKDREPVDGIGDTELKKIEDESVIARPRQVCKDKSEDNITVREYTPVTQHGSYVSTSSSVQQSKPKLTDYIGSIQVKEEIPQRIYSLKKHCDISNNLNLQGHRDSIIIETKVPLICPNNDSRKNTDSRKPEQKKPAQLLDYNIDKTDTESHKTVARKPEPISRPHKTNFLGNQQTTLRPDAHQLVATSPKENPRVREKKEYPNHIHANDGDGVKCHMKYYVSTEHVEQKSCHGEDCDRYYEPCKDRKPGGGDIHLNGPEDAPITLATRQASTYKHGNHNTAEEHVLIRKKVTYVSNTEIVKKDKPEKTDTVGGILHKGVSPEKHSQTSYCDTSKTFKTPVHRDTQMIDTEVPRSGRKTFSRNSYAQGSKPKKPANTDLDCKIVRSDTVGSNSAPPTSKPEPTILTQKGQYLGKQHALIGPKASPHVVPKQQDNFQSRDTRNYPDLNNANNKGDVKWHLVYNGTVEQLEQRSSHVQDSAKHDETHNNIDLGGKLWARKLNESEDMFVMTALRQDRHDDDITVKDNVLLREHVAHTSTTNTVKESEAKRTNGNGNIQQKAAVFSGDHSPAIQCGDSKNFYSLVHREEVPGICSSNDPRKNDASPEPKKLATLLDCIIDRSDDEESNPAPDASRSTSTVLPENTQYLLDHHTPEVITPLALKPKEKPRSWEKKKYPDRANDNDVTGHLIYLGGSSNLEKRRYPGQDSDRRAEPHKHIALGGGQQKRTLNESACVPVMTEKIILLRINKYNLTPSDNVTVFLEEKQGNVVIKGVTQVDITAEKLRLDEHLERICESTETLSVPMSCFLCQKEVCDHMRYICEQEQLKVVVHVTANQQTLHCLAFTKDEANKGLQIIKDTLHTRHVSFRQGQLDLIRGQKWSDFIEQFKGSLGMVYISEDRSRVMVEGFTREAVETTNQKVVEFLKDNIAKLTINLELYGAKARCFQTCMQPSLEQTIREKHGYIKVDVLKDVYPIKLRVTVEGDDSVIKVAQTCLDQIWHEKLDIRKISDKEMDVCLMINGLTGTHRKPFLEKFQRENNCFIDVIEDGHLPPSALPFEKAQAFQPRQPSPEPNVSSKFAIQRSARRSEECNELTPDVGLSIYQPSAMREEDAIEEAMRLSTQVEQEQNHQLRESSSEPRATHSPTLQRSPRRSEYHNELRPGFGLSIYQPSDMREDDAIEVVKILSTQAEQEQSHTLRKASPDPREFEFPTRQRSPRRSEENNELTPDFSLSKYQPLSMREDDAIEVVKILSTQDEQEQSHTLRKASPDPREYEFPIRQRSPRRSEENNELTPDFSLSKYQPLSMKEEDAFEAAKILSTQDEQEDIMQPIPQQEYGLHMQPHHLRHQRHQPSSSSSSDSDTDEEGIPIYRSRSYHTPQCVEPSPKCFSPTMNNVTQQSNGRRRVNRNMQYSTTICETKVTLQRGEIAKFKADCLVNIVGPSLNLDEGTVSKSFLRVGGHQLNTLFLNGMHYRLTSGGTVIQSSVCGKLQCQSVCHVVLNKDVGSCSQVVQEAVSKVLAICTDQGYHSVAFPPLGVGRMFQYDESVVAQAMLQGTACFLAQHSDVLSSPLEVGRRMFQSFKTMLQRGTKNFLSKQTLNEVTFVIYDRDEEVFSEFKSQIKALESGQPSDLTQILHQLFLPATAFHGNQNVCPNPATSGARPKTSHGSPRRAPSRVKRGAVYDRKSSPSVDIQDDVRDVHHAAARKATGQDDAVKRGSTFPKDTPEKNLYVDVVAENKDTCLTAKKTLGESIKDEFLFEDNIKKMAKVPHDAKVKIEAILTKHKVSSSPGQDGYTITGQKYGVGNAVKEILQVFIDYGCKSERAVQAKDQHRQHAQRETLEYVRFMVGEEPEVPRYWKNFKPGEPLKTTFTEYKSYGGKWAKVRLDPSDPIYESIQQLINNTWDSSKLGKGLDAKGLQRLSYKRMKVTQIDRIENLDLYHEYTQKRVKVFTGLLQRGRARFPEIHQLPGCTGKVQSAYYADKCLLKDMNTEINEFYFFHGTKPQNVSVICHQGLDNRLASGSAMFGQGIYGAETPTKADQYADDQDNRTGGRGQPKQMFLLRIILGKAFVCKEHNPHKFKRPPCVTCKRDDCRNQKHRGLFDSVVGDNKKLFREFVVYDKGLCYPEYLITYERL